MKISRPFFLELDIMSNSGTICEWQRLKERKKVGKALQWRKGKTSCKHVLTGEAGGGLTNNRVSYVTVQGSIFGFVHLVLIGSGGGSTKVWKLSVIDEVLASQGDCYRGCGLISWTNCYERCYLVRVCFLVPFFMTWPYLFIYLISQTVKNCHVLSTRISLYAFKK